MKRTTVAALIVAAVGMAVLASTLPSRAVAGPALPEMCNGSSVPNLVINAHATGRPNAVPKYILNVQTNGSGVATGAMILGKGSGRLIVSDWCRVWQHQPGQESGGCDAPYPPGAITVHAVGIVEAGVNPTIVRTDIRKYADGRTMFRVRYRAWTPGEGDETNESDSCDDDGWTRVPAEGWYPLDQFNVRTGG